MDIAGCRSQCNILPRLNIFFICYRSSTDYSLFSFLISFLSYITVSLQCAFD